MRWWFRIVCVTILVFINFSFVVKVFGNIVTLPEQCANLNLYPCGLYAKQAGYLEKKMGNIHFKKKSKLFWLKPTTLALLFGDFLLTGNLGKVILPGGNVLITNTDSLAMVQIDKESVVLKVYQGEVTISQVQPALKLRLGPFQEVRWTKGQWGIPTHIVLLRSVVADWQGFPRRASKLLERVFSAGGLKASAHELGFVYRSIAQAYQDQREAKYRKILDDQKRGERKRQQLKYWFRQRVFDPLRWEQFWNSPQLDDQ